MNTIVNISTLSSLFSLSLTEILIKNSKKLASYLHCPLMADIFFVCLGISPIFSAFYFHLLPLCLVVVNIFVASQATFWNIQLKTLSFHPIICLFLPILLRFVINSSNQDVFFFSSIIYISLFAIYLFLFMFLLEKSTSSFSFFFFFFASLEKTFFLGFATNHRRDNSKSQGRHRAEPKKNIKNSRDDAADQKRQGASLCREAKPPKGGQAMH